VLHGLVYWKSDIASLLTEEVCKRKQHRRTCVSSNHRTVHN
jgi:hypothetical protein